MLTATSQNAIVANVKQCTQLTTAQLCQAYDILHDGYKANSSPTLKATEMKAILLGRNQVSCSFTRYALVIGYLQSIGVKII